MKDNYTIYILIIILIIISVGIYFYNIKIIEENFQENKNTEVIDFYEGLAIGNTLACYFYSMGLAFLHGKHFHTNSINGRNDFIKNLPTTVEFDKHIQDAFIAAGITNESLDNELFKINGLCVSSWTVLSKERESFWTIIKPTVNRLLKQALEKSGLSKNIDAPIIHYRCSDVPFLRMSNYHFHKYSFFKNGLNIIQQKTGKKYDKVYISYCNKHESSKESQESCDIYYNSFVQYLESLRYDVIPKCNSADEDFASMFYAPGLISTSSSFSFMAGFFSDGVFISSFYDEKSDRTCDDCGDWLQTGHTLKHSEVQDYHDEKKVISQLQ